jgi:hypothetical protein
MTYQNLLLLHICCFLGALLFFWLSFFLEPPHAPFVMGVLLMIGAVVTRLRLSKHRK